jgi:spore coat polysaccharide biosynthesis protein SpsF
MVRSACETPKAIAIIQARCSSTRLPGKVLKPLAGQPMIWHIVQRAESCEHVDQVVVATSAESSDDPLAEFCEQAGLGYFRGSLGNVLSRYLAVLEQVPHAYVVRVTGDCPLIHPRFIDRQIELLDRYDADMVRLEQPSSLLEGQGVHSTRSLRQVAERSTHPDDLEHVGSRYFSEKPELFRTVELQVPEELKGNRWRLTVDEEADYALMAELYGHLYQGKPFPLEEAAAFLESHPELATMNQDIQHSPINQELAVMRETSCSLAVATVPW